MFSRRRNVSTVWQSTTSLQAVPKFGSGRTECSVAGSCTPRSRLLVCGSRIEFGSSLPDLSTLHQFALSYLPGHFFKTFPPSDISASEQLSPVFHVIGYSPLAATI